MSRYTFKNSTQVSHRNVVVPLIPIQFDSAEAVLSMIAGTPSTPSSSNSATPVAPLSPSATSSGAPRFKSYPSPIVEHSEGMVAGYFLEGDTSDVAVLNIPTFTSDLSAYPEFQSVVRKFLQLCANKTRLLIDVRGNDGGNPFLAFDTFKQLFPNAGAPYSGTRFRAQPLADAIGLQVAKLVNGRAAVVTPEDALVDFSPFNYQTGLKNPDGAPFGSWSEFFGPNQEAGDNFSSIASFSFSNSTYDVTFGQIVPSGEANNSKIAPSPFDAGNITIVRKHPCSTSNNLLTVLM
jgi:hypothetical protein